MRRNLNKYVKETLALMNLYLERYYEHNRKSIGATLETDVPLDLPNIFLKHAGYGIT